MTKKNIRPQQVAPVQRQTAAHSSLQTAVHSSLIGCQPSQNYYDSYSVNPFAGDDAE